MRIAVADVLGGLAAGMRKSSAIIRNSLRKTFGPAWLIEKKSEKRALPHGRATETG
jgi:hypothetical protein